MTVAAPRSHSPNLDFSLVLDQATLGVLRLDGALAFLALRHFCWPAEISRRALAPVKRNRTGANALRLMYHKKW